MLMHMSQVDICSVLHATPCMLPLASSFSMVMHSACSACDVRLRRNLLQQQPCNVFDSGFGGISAQVSLRPVIA